MKFNRHSELEGRHATLSASKYHWIRYSEEKFVERIRTDLAAMRGTELHAFASEAIRLDQKMTDARLTLPMYVNDAIGFRMKPEIVLAYSNNAFGTADALSFRKNLLRIHDLKTGVTPASFDQLKIYTAYFCLEYGIKPAKIDIELRIYQNDDIQICVPDIDDIMYIMDRTIIFDRIIEELKAEAFDD